MTEYETFLRGALASAKYRDPEKTRRSILELINHYRGLKPSSDDFVFNNGTSKNLVALKGTIPIVYKSATYHIPVTIWLLDTYPYNAPMVFVVPTPDMRIKVSKHVDHNGKVYLPYLHDWKHNTSDLLCLVQVLIMTFSEAPPVYSVPPSQQIHQQQPTFATPYPVQSSSAAYPAYPMGMPMPMPGGGGMPPPSGAQPMPPSSASAVNNHNNPTPGTPTYSIRPSLITATEEKVRRRLEDVFFSKEITKTTGKQLGEGQERLEVMMKRLSDEKALLEQNIEACSKECSLLDDKIAKSATEDNTGNIDDAIQTTAPLYRQIVNTVAEEAALEDTIYYLGNALGKEKMDLDQYLRTVRQLSRRQFLLRATLKKCKQRAGIAG